MTIVFDEIGGYCPCQAKGTINDARFYFRARHGDWTFDIAETHERAVDGSMEWEPRERPGLFYHASGDDPDDGYMEPEMAERIIREHAAKWIALQELTQ